jgi:hypothetical protein
MNKHLYRAAALVGLLAIAWVAAGYLRPHALANPLALGMTLLIAAFYGMGMRELHRFQQDTAGLQRALDGLGAPPDRLSDWLDQVPAPLRHTVRARVDGDRAGLPGPTLTPYLVGLLVLLGMLGTFLGMVVTLNGTGLALENATDVQTMRDSLSAPVRGLGLAFGTSVAGVAGSAMLGLMSALSRRERMLAGQRLDSRTATTLHGFSRAFQQHQQREQALQLQQQQAQHLPALVAQLQALATQLDQQARQSHEQLLASQTRFHGGAEQAYRDLAASVDQTLQRSLTQSLADGARVAAAALQPAVEATLAGISRETTALHDHVARTVQQQLDGYAQHFEAQTRRWVDAAGTQLQQQGSRLLGAMEEAQTRQQAQLAAAAEQQRAAWLATLEAVGAQAQEQARHTVAEVARLVQTASEAPRAAASVVAELRGKLSESLARDNDMLEERSRILDTLNGLLGAVQHTATEQRAAIDKMVASTADWLDRAGARFTQQVDAESARLDSVAAQLTGSAVDVASLGEAFGTAVDLFSQSSGQMLAQLQRVEEALARSSARSDDQLAYCVAQAREVIDLSLLSQKQIVDDLQRLARQNAVAAAEA